MALLGAAAFVLSLACCAWTYFITWGTARRSGFSLPALVVDVLLFTMFAMHHSVTAREPIKARIEALAGERGVRTLYVWLASLLLILVCLAWQPVGGDLYAHGGLLALPHIVVQLAGVWLTVVAVRLLDPLELAGLRPVASTPLQIRGPYHWVRHPLYLGWMLMFFGSAHMTADRLAFATVSSLYLVLAIPWEERSLIRAFGDSYKAYVTRVRWRVIPYVY